MKRREIRLLSQTLKHLRGRHDQRDHNRWPAGYQAQTYVPTGRRGSAMTARATGGLAGITQSETLLNQGLQQKIKDFQKERALKRLPYNFDVSPYKAQMQYVGSGVSKVKTFTAGNEVYYYRDTPAYNGAQGYGDAIDNWFSMPGYYFPLVADSLSSAMGVDVAPVAQMSNEGRIVTTAIDINGSKSSSYAINDLVSELQNHYTPQKYAEVAEMIEPHVVMALILGQGDGHYGNISMINNPTTSAYSAKTIFGSVDYDLSGNRYINDSLVNAFFNEIMPTNQGGPGNEKMFSSKTEEILLGIYKNIEWHPDITYHAKFLIMARIDTLIQANEDIAAGTIIYNGKTVQDYVESQLYNVSYDINKMNRDPLFGRDMAIELQNLVEPLDADYEYAVDGFNRMESTVGNDLAQEFFKQVYGSTFDDFQKEIKGLREQIFDVSKRFLNERRASKVNALINKSRIIKWRRDYRNKKNTNLYAFSSVPRDIIIDVDANIKDINNSLKELKKQIDIYKNFSTYYSGPTPLTPAKKQAQKEKAEDIIMNILGQTFGLALKNKKARKFAFYLKNYMHKDPRWLLDDFIYNPDEAEKFFEGLKNSIKK